MFQVFEGKTADEVWQRVAQTFQNCDGIALQSSRAGSTYEILHAAMSISNPLQRWIVSRQPPINPAFALAEVVWILTGRNDSAFLNYFNRDLRKFSGNESTYHGAYGYRLRYHIGTDQLDRAYKALMLDPDSRQVVLQIWDSEADLPDDNGNARDPDIPCNLLSVLKVRDAKLEWMQIMRSNDLFLGSPYNFIQFTYLQEILAGWLNVGVGSYNQISDSLHVYEKDYDSLKKFRPEEPAPNIDSIALDKDNSEKAFNELASRIDIFGKERLSKAEHLKLALWPEAPKAFQNILYVLAAEAARRRGWIHEALEIMGACSNPIFAQTWGRWFNRVNKKLISHNVI